MKKLLCLISSIVACIGMCSVSFAATLKDVKNTKYEDAVVNLIEVGLVDGFEDNTYRPQEAVTRAQMAKLMVIALGQEYAVDDASHRSTSFTDMNSNHWAYGFINVAKDTGIINGYMDGSFNPDATVSYAEAVTMAVRALGYEDRVEQLKDTWPNNYISCAKELSLFKNIGTFSNNSGAGRGDVAILLWNMLNTGVSKVVAQNNNGLVYGQGEIMLSKYKNYTYIKAGNITSVKFDEDYENATVVVTDTNSESLKLTLSDTDVLKYFGKELTILYDTNKKKVLNIESAKKYKEINGDVIKTTSKKIYIDDDNYNLPDKSNIILYRADSISEAVEATLYMENSNVKYVLASGAKSIDVALVTERNVTVSKKDGIKIKKVGSTSTPSYALINEKDMPAKYSIIFYYLNSNDELGILKEIDSDDASSISSHTSSKMKIGKTTYTYDSDKHTIYAATSSNIKTLAFKNIDEEDDKVYVYEYAGTTYFIVFTDTAENESNKTSAYKDLQSYIKSVESKESKEYSYSQETFVPFFNALTSARAIKSSDSITKISGAMEDLKVAYDDLKTVSSYSSDGKIASKRSELRQLVNGGANEIVKNKSKYTSDSYTTFEDALKVANKILSKTNTTLDDVTDAYDDLDDVINKKMVLVTNTEEHKTALADLNTAIERGKDITSKDYTEKSYAAFKTAYDVAVTAKNNASSKSATELKTATTNLNNAISGLEFAIDTVKSNLNALIVKCIDLVDNEEDYMPDTFKTFEAAYEEARDAVEGEDIAKMKAATEKLEKAKKALRLVDDELAAVVKVVEKMKDAEHVADALKSDDKTSAAKIKKMNNIKSAVKLDLEELIEDANGKSSDDDDGSLNIAIGNAKKALKDSKKLRELVDAYSNLKNELPESTKS